MDVVADEVWMWLSCSSEAVAWEWMGTQMSVLEKEGVLQGVLGGEEV